MRALDGKLNSKLEWPNLRLISAETFQGYYLFGNHCSSSAETVEG